MKTDNLAFLFAVIYSWASLVLSLGLVLSFADDPSLITGVGLVVGIGIALPVNFFYRNLDQLDRELPRLFQEKKPEFVLASLFFAASSVSFVYGYSFPGSFILNLSFQASASLFFPVKNLYSSIGTVDTGSLVFNYGRWYLHLLWTYLLASLVTDGYRKMRGGDKKGDSDDLRAGILPGKTAGSSDVRVAVYVVTGFHGLLRVPESFCKECNMFVNTAHEAAEQVDFDVEVDVRSYWTRFLIPVLKGGTHPPVMMVDGELLAQGYDVPDTAKVRRALEEAVR